MLKLSMPKTLKLLAWACLAQGLLLSAASPAAAGEVHPPVPDELAAVLFHKALLYDQNLGEGADNAVNLAIVYFGEKSAERARSVSSALTRLFGEDSLERRADLTYDYSILKYSEVSLENTIKRKKISIVYVVTAGDHETNQLEHIRELAKSNKALTLVDDPTLVDEYFALSLDLENDKARIWINLNRSKEEGRQFTTPFLRLCHVVDR